MLSRRIWILAAISLLASHAYGQNTTGTVDFDVDTLHDMQQVSIFLSDDSTLLVNRTDVDDFGPETYVWSGVVEGVSESIVVFSIDGEFAFGTIDTIERLWELTLPSGSEPAIKELTPSDFYLDEREIPMEAEHIHSSGFEESLFLETKADSLLTALSTPACVDKATIDILFVYTSQVASSFPNIQARINGAVEAANWTFERDSITDLSGNPVRLRAIPQSFQVEYPDLHVANETADKLAMWAAVQLLARRDTLGVMDEVLDYRERYDADVVILLVENFGSGIVKDRSTDPEDAFGVINWRYLKSHTLAHEIGHLFGAKHDRYAENETDTTDYPGLNYGFVYKPGAVRTLMSYSTECDEQPPPLDCYQTPRFSSQSGTHNGSTLGDVYHDNLSHVRTNSEVAACHRQNPKIVDIPFADGAFEACVLQRASNNGWTHANEVTQLNCSNMGITSLDGIEYLNRLTWLDVYQNDISSLQPVEHLTQLKVLQIYQNNVSDLGPLTRLFELEALEANDNNISDITPLSHHQNFWWLTIANNPVSDITPIENYTKLRVLNLAGTSVTELSVLARPNLATMTNLNVDSLSISDISPLSGMVNMLALGASRNSISDISALLNMDQLERLDLNRNLLESAGLEPIKNLPALKHLFLEENRIFDVEPLTGLDHLLELFLRNQEWPPGLDCDQQFRIQDALTGTFVLVDGFWDDPNDNPDQGPLECNPLVVNVPFADAALESCVEAKAAQEGWVRAYDVLNLQCTELGIASLEGLEYFRDVTALDLFRNNIQDLSPIAKLFKLTWLQVFINQIDSLEPLRNLLELQVLEANVNNIPSLEPLTNHRKFWWLTVAENPITYITPVADFPVLQTFNIARTNVSDISSIENLKTLINLDLGDLGLIDSDLSALEGLTNLRRLTLERNNISDISPLQNLLNLDFLWLWRNNIVDISALASLTKLTVLDAGANQIADLNALRNLTMLDHLWLPVNNISDVSALSGLSALSRVRLSENFIADATPLHPLTQLEYLDLNNQNNLLNCVQQQAIVASLPSTEVIVSGIWDDPDDDPDQGNINCFP
jgi:Leucine-rich repeat (LRR) protein